MALQRKRRLFKKRRHWPALAGQCLLIIRRKYEKNSQIFSWFTRWKRYGFHKLFNVYDNLKYLCPLYPFYLWNTIIKQILHCCSNKCVHKLNIFIWFIQIKMYRGYPVTRPMEIHKNFIILFEIWKQNCKKTICTKLKLCKNLRWIYVTLCT